MTKFLPVAIDQPAGTVNVAPPGELYPSSKERDRRTGQAISPSRRDG
jgi:hypothetical protein